MGEELNIGSFDELVNPQPETKEEEKEQTLQEKFSAERYGWSSKVSAMSKKLGSVEKTAELMTEIYTERQRALEYYHYLIGILVQINKSYSKSYSEKYQFYKYQSQERIPNETLIKNRIESELADLKEKRELIDNHAKFMDGTVKTIDNIIYGIKYKVEITQIGRGR